jgi:hypothetical protein
MVLEPLYLKIGRQARLDLPPNDYLESFAKFWEGQDGDPGHSDSVLSD